MINWAPSLKQVHLYKREIELEQEWISICIKKKYTEILNFTSDMLLSVVSCWLLVLARVSPQYNMAAFPMKDIWGRKKT